MFFFCGCTTGLNMKRSRMPVRMVSVIANCESSPSVKSIAKKRIAHRVGNGNLVIKVIEVIKVNEVTRSG